MKAILFAALVAASPAACHDWYSDKVTSTGAGCCGGGDCGPINPSSLRRSDDGYDVTLKAGDLPSLQANNWQQKLPGGAVVDRPGIGNGSVVFHFIGEPGLSPDGQVHGCVWAGDILERKMRCLFLGGTS